MSYGENQILFEAKNAVMKATTGSRSASQHAEAGLLS